MRNVVHVEMDSIEVDWVNLENNKVVSDQIFDRIPFEVEFHVHEFLMNVWRHTAIQVLIGVVWND